MDYKQEQYLRMQQYQYAPRMPFYMSYPVQNIYMTEMEYERDMERMKELYPQEAKQIQKLVEDECDQMEYEGSMMFDEYPDRVMLKVICERIYENATKQDAEDAKKALDLGKNLDKNLNKAEEMKELQDAADENEIEIKKAAKNDLEKQDFWGPGRPPGPPGPPPPPPGPPPPPPGWAPGPPRNPGLNTLIEVMLYNEMYKRRCRHNRCRRWW